jgi:two-component system, NarL family, response regulator NreC
MKVIGDGVRAMVNIILAEDHKVVRKGLNALLSSEPDFKVVGEAESGQEALDLVEKLQPDILVLDLVMPGLNGLEVARILGRQPGRTRIVVLSMHNSDVYIYEALRLGALAYILKESPAEELIRGIREAASGRRYLGFPLSAKLIEDYSIHLQQHQSAFCSNLTRREKEILQMAARGCSNNEIAACLDISLRTVETHRNNLMHKLDLHSPIQLANTAVQLGLLDSPDHHAITDRPAR